MPLSHKDIGGTRWFLMVGLVDRDLSVTSSQSFHLWDFCKRAVDCQAEAPSNSYHFIGPG
jgi:hypothetical protein